MVIRYIYCGKIDLTKLQGLDVLKLLLIVDEFNIQTLIPCAQQYLIRILQDPIRILETIYQNEQFTELLNSCLEKFARNPKCY